MLTAGLVGSLDAWPAAEPPQPAPDPPSRRARTPHFGQSDNVRVFSGFSERVYRLGFDYEDRFPHVVPALLTVSPSGASESGGLLPPMKKQGLLSPAYPQSLALEVA